MQESFTYTSQPHAAPGPKRKTKYRDENLQDDLDSKNIMHDPRVIRGNTYAAKSVTSNLKKEPGSSLQKREGDNMCDSETNMLHAYALVRHLCTQTCCMCMQ